MWELQLHIGQCWAAWGCQLCGVSIAAAIMATAKDGLWYDWAARETCNSGASGCQGSSCCDGPGVNLDATKGRVL